MIMQELIDKVVRKSDPWKSSIIRLPITTGPAIVSAQSGSPKPTIPIIYGNPDSDTTPVFFTTEELANMWSGTDWWGHRPQTSTTTETGCSHQWMMYTGFTETYEYCKHCDLKRGLSNAKG